MNGHLLHLTVEKEGFVSWHLTCEHPLEIGNPFEIFHVGPDGDCCRCEREDCPCREGGHDECVGLPGWVPETGPLCQCVGAGGCWYQTWWEEVGGECIGAAATWVPDMAWPVWVRHDKAHPWDGLVLIPDEGDTDE